MVPERRWPGNRAAVLTHVKFFLRFGDQGAIGDVREWNDFFHFSARGGIIDGRLKRLVGHASRL